MKVSNRFAALATSDDHSDGEVDHSTVNEVLPPCRITQEEVLQMIDDEPGEGWIRIKKKKPKSHVVVQRLAEEINKRITHLYLYPIEENCLIVYDDPDKGEHYTNYTRYDIIECYAEKSRICFRVKNKYVRHTMNIVKCRDEERCRQRHHGCPGYMYNNINDEIIESEDDLILTFKYGKCHNFGISVWNEWIKYINVDYKYFKTRFSSNRVFCSHFQLNDIMTGRIKVDDCEMMEPGTVVSRTQYCYMSR